MKQEVLRAGGLVMRNNEFHWSGLSIKKSSTVSPYTYICSLHFKEKKKTHHNDIPTIFPWTNSTDKRKPPTICHFTPPEVKKRKQEDDLTKQLQSYATTLAKLQDEYSTLQKQLQDVKEELESIRLSHVERFCLQRFQGSDEDIRFYTGLPSYTVVFCCVCTIFLNLYSRTSTIVKVNTHNPLLSHQRLL